MIGAFVSAPPPDRRVIVDPALLPYRDRACLRILYRADVATTAQLVTLVYHRRQTAQERLAAMHAIGLLDRAVLAPISRGGAPLAFRVSAKARRRLGYDPLTRSRAGTQLRHSLNVVETVCALIRADRGDFSGPLVHAWLTEPMATDLLPHTYPDSVVALQAPAGSGVLCLEIDEGTEHGPDIRDKLARYAHGFQSRTGWHVVFVAGSRERVDFLARVAKRNDGYPGLRGRGWALVLGELRAHGLSAIAVPLHVGGQRMSVATLLTDPRPRVCPTPVATDDWLRILGYGGGEEIDEALR
ncbi:MAG: hypothetical protein E6I94_09150 [Chloroflexi bacterium]|nr:MAG: hypothetical protein E6I94_09150 [Chloroflexota bacterium]